MAAYLVVVPTILCGWLFIPSPPLLSISILPFHIIITSPKTQHCMSISLYLFLQIYIHNFLPQLTHYGTHCSLNLSGFPFPIPDLTYTQVNNSNQPSDVLPTYPERDIYLIDLKIGRVPHHILPGSFVSLFHLAIKESMCNSLLWNNRRNCTQTSQQLTLNSFLWKLLICCIFLVPPQLIYFHRLFLTIRSLSRFIFSSKNPPGVPWCNVNTWNF